MEKFTTDELAEIFIKSNREINRWRAAFEKHGLYFEKRGKKYYYTNEQYLLFSKVHFLLHEKLENLEEAVEQVILGIETELPILTEKIPQDTNEPQYVNIEYVIALENQFKNWICEIEAQVYENMEDLRALEDQQAVDRAAAIDRMEDYKRYINTRDEMIMENIRLLQQSKKRSWFSWLRIFTSKKA